jgi:hypothetical protein
MTCTKRRLVSVHEAGHAIVAMYMGKDIKEIRVDVPVGDDDQPEGGGYCLNYWPRNWRSWHAASSLAGVLACAIHCRDFPYLAEYNNWEHCHEDMRLFNADREGMTYRQGRRICLGILKEWEDRLLELADILERDGFVTNDNAPDWCKGKDCAQAESR